MSCSLSLCFMSIPLIVYCFFSDRFHKVYIMGKLTFFIFIMQLEENQIVLRKWKD